MPASPPPALAPEAASVRHLPVSLFAAVMGLSGLALAWRLAHRSLAAPAFVGEAIGAFAVLVFVLISLGYGAKLVRHPQAVLAEFRHPVASSFFGTIAISVLLLSAVVAPYSAQTAAVLWTGGAAASFVLVYLAVSRLLQGGVDASHAVPPWLIAGVATLNIAVTGGHMPMAWAAEVKLIAGAIGSVLALLLLAMIVSRLVLREPMAPGLTPSLMILVAPFAVGFLAYTQIVGGVDRFAGVLFYRDRLAAGVSPRAAVHPGLVGDRVPDGRAGQRGVPLCGVHGEQRAARAGGDAAGSADPGPGGVDGADGGRRSVGGVVQVRGRGRPWAERLGTTCRPDAQDAAGVAGVAFGGWVPSALRRLRPLAVLRTCLAEMVLLPTRFFLDSAMSILSSKEAEDTGSPEPTGP